MALDSKTLQAKIEVIGVLMAADQYTEAQAYVKTLSGEEAVMMILVLAELTHNLKTGMRR